MNSLKDKMFNYEVPPPQHNWQIIATALDKINYNTSQPQKINKGFYISLAAAAVTIVFFTVVIWFNNQDKEENITVQSTKINGIDTSTSDYKITVPATNEDNDLLASETSRHNLNKSLKNEPSDQGIKKYITISNPQGRPVKISSKVVSLIVSSDNKYPPNPVWSEKVKKWKEIMQANTLAPTTANFLDIVELTHAVNNRDLK